ncbi:hypothetical protein K1719_025102 [Acacia pycnantha]|nr:hypothetical protein K1719_025102 [Acacia pycnantha]
MSANNPVDSFFNSVKVVQELLSPLEVGIRQAAKFEHCFAGAKKKGNGAQVSEDWKFQICAVKKKKTKDEKKKGLQNSINGSKEKALTNDDRSYTNSLQFAVNWSLLVNGFLQSLPTPFKSGQKRLQKKDAEDYPCWSEPKQTEFHGQSFEIFQDKDVKKEVNHVPFECFIGFISHHLTPNLNKLDQGLQGNDCDREKTILMHPSSGFNHLKAFISNSILEGHQVYANRFLQNLKFAKVGGVPSRIVDASLSAKQEGDGSATVENREEMGRIKSSGYSISSTELMELLQEHPNVKKLFPGQDFCKYTEDEGRRLFEELDRDGDGKVTLEDLKVAMRMRKLPPSYAHEFMSRTKSHLFSKSFGWKQFSSVMEQKEPTILRAYTSLCLGKSGTLTKSEILESLKNAGLPANEDNAVVMTRFLNADTEGSISYRHFRSFMLLLPPYYLQKDPRSTAVAVPPPVEKPAESVIISALAGGISCAMSCALMHPVDTIKTQVQASTLTLPQIISKLPQMGARGLYRGSIPAILGQFSSHGLRTGISEASRLVLINVAPTLPNFQIQSITSFSSTFLGTAARIPCEVLKQQLQAGLYDNVGRLQSGFGVRLNLGVSFAGL